MVGSVTGYQAGLETTSTQLSYALESQWATLPSNTFQAMRILSESLKHNKTRTRPQEIRGDRQAAAALTTQEAASGSIVMPVYYSMPGQTPLEVSQGGRSTAFDDFISCLLGSDWGSQSTALISGVSGDIVLTWNPGAKTVTLSSSTANKFITLVNAVGNMVKIKGFTNPVNNGVYRIAGVTSAMSVTLVPQGFTPITETPTGTNATVWFSGIKNGPYFKTLYLQQRLNPLGSLWFRYPGAYPTRGQISLQLGQFLQATFDMAVQQEQSATSDASTGGIINVPNSLDMDPVGGFQGVYWNDTLLSTGVDQFTFDLSNDGAAAQYALGSPYAQGMMGGTFLGAGSFRIYIKDLTLYNNFRNEVPGILTIRTGDRQGNMYSISIPNALLLLNNGVNASGPNKSLMGEFSLEASPDSASGATVCIDRIPYTV